MKRMRIMLWLLVILLLGSLVACDKETKEKERKEKPRQAQSAETPAAQESEKKKQKEAEPSDFDLPEPLPEQLQKAGDFDSWDEVVSVFPVLTGEQLREPLHADERVVIGGTFEIPRTILEGWPICNIWDEGPNGFTSTMVVFDMDFILTTDPLCRVETALDIENGILGSDSQGAAVTGPPRFASYPDFFEYVLEHSPYADYASITTADEGPRRIWKVEGTIRELIESDTARDDQLFCVLEEDGGQIIFFQFPFDYGSVDKGVGDRIVGVGFSEGMHTKELEGSEEELEAPWMFILYGK